jgi:hypothetical protein
MAEATASSKKLLAPFNTDGPATHQVGGASSLDVYAATAVMIAITVPGGWRLNGLLGFLSLLRLRWLSDRLCLRMGNSGRNRTNRAHELVSNRNCLRVAWVVSRM